MSKISKKEIDKYLITKYMGGGANNPPAKNIKYELEGRYEFAYTTVFGKKGLTIKKKNGKNS
tara:strand:+ start:400 stop:585 length:186 start_codon:yes stop_codon:yes gene_type:complete